MMISLIAFVGLYEKVGNASNQASKIFYSYENKRPCRVHFIHRNSPYLLSEGTVPTDYLSSVGKVPTGGILSVGAVPTDSLYLLL